MALVSLRAPSGLRIAVGFAQFSLEASFVEKRRPSILVGHRGWNHRHICKFVDRRVALHPGGVGHRGLECDDRARGSYSARSQQAVPAYVRPDVIHDVAGVKQSQKRILDFGLHSEPSKQTLSPLPAPTKMGKAARRAGRVSRFSMRRIRRWLRRKSFARKMIP